jgi:NADP-dependent 3-hydroxy acid dehydrogenase YdfG
LTQSLNKKGTFPPQHQNRQPGLESEMNPKPEAEDVSYRSSGKLQDKTVIITGGDSGIGRAVAIHFAKEGANIVLSYLNEHEDANETKRQVEEENRTCILIAGDIGDENFCKQIVNQTIQHFGKLDILVNNAAEQHPQPSLSNITANQLERTFRTNIFSYFYMAKAALPFLQKGSSIINTASVTAYKGNEQLLDYSATKGAVVTFTRSLALSLVNQGITSQWCRTWPYLDTINPFHFFKSSSGNFWFQYPNETSRPAKRGSSSVCFPCKR